MTTNEKALSHVADLSTDGAGITVDELVQAIAAAADGLREEEGQAAERMHYTEAGPAAKYAYAKRANTMGDIALALEHILLAVGADAGNGARYRAPINPRAREVTALDDMMKEMRR